MQKPETQEIDLAGSEDILARYDCRELEVLYLERNPLSNINLENLSGLANLKGLWFRSTNLEELNIESLENCKELKWLDFSENPFENLNINSIIDLESLELLLIDDSVIIQAPTERENDLSSPGLEKLSGRIQWI